MSPTKRRIPWMAGIVVVSGALLGGYFGGTAQADPEKPEDLLWTFGRILALVEDQYVGEVDSEESSRTRSTGMLRTLDPHSNYLNAETRSPRCGTSSAASSTGWASRSPSAAPTSR